MKRLLLPLCAICLLVRPCSTAADIGKVMYIGDSITHGVNSASYRWEMHKILVDNGITYREIGINTGNTPGAPRNAPPPSFTPLGVLLYLPLLPMKCLRYK